MLSVEALRLLRGYVRFRADGGFPERFVNYCAAHNFPLWNLHTDKCGVSACINAKEYRLLRQASRVSGCNIAITEKRGLPFFARRKRERIGIPIGIGLFALFMLLVSGSVWSITVTGCDRLNEEMLLKILEENDIFVGCRKKSISPSVVEDAILTQLEDTVFWTSLNLKGCSAVLELREYPVTEKFEGGFGGPCNLVAEFDGVIVGMSVLSGKPAVSVGSGVKTGDLLVSGIIQNGDLSTSFYEADGEVAARHEVSLSVTAKRKMLVQRYLNCDNSFALRLFSVRIPLNHNKMSENHLRSLATSSTRLNGVTLPVVFEKTLLSDWESQQVELTEKQCKLLTVRQFVSEYLEQTRDALVISSNTAISDNGNGYTVSYTADCIENVGIQKAIITADN